MYRPLRPSQTTRQGLQQDDGDGPAGVGFQGRLQGLLSSSGLEAEEGFQLGMCVL